MGRLPLVGSPISLIPPPSLRLRCLVHDTITVCPCPIFVNFWFIRDPIQPSVQFSFKILGLLSFYIPYFTWYGIEESHHLSGRTIIYINVEFLLFLFHFTLVSFIVLCLALSFNSNPNMFFSGSSNCCHVLIIMYLSLLLSMLYKFRHFSLWWLFFSSIPSIFLVYPFCILSSLLMSFLCNGDHTIQQYSALLLMCDLNRFNMGSFFLVSKFLKILPCFILHEVITSLMCSLNLRSALVKTPRSFTLSIISISSPDGVLYASASTSFVFPQVICSNFFSLNFMTFFSAHWYILFRSSCIAFLSSSVLMCLLFLVTTAKQLTMQFIISLSMSPIIIPM